VRILAFDYGTRSIGVAVSDALGLTAQGVRVIRHTPRMWEEIAGLIKEYGPDPIVVGLPRNMDGSYGPSADGAQGFARELEERFGCPVVFWDERLSTVGAQRALLEADLSREKRKKVLDKMAAVFILQGYLDREHNRKNSESG
jgi:putative Holliday junction resolvase